MKSRLVVCIALVVLASFLASADPEPRQLEMKYHRWFMVKLPRDVEKKTLFADFLEPGYEFTARAAEWTNADRDQREVLMYERGRPVRKQLPTAPRPVMNLDIFAREEGTKRKQAVDSDARIAIETVLLSPDKGVPVRIREPGGSLYFWHPAGIWLSEDVAVQGISDPQLLREYPEVARISRPERDGKFVIFQVYKWPKGDMDVGAD